MDRTPRRDARCQPARTAAGRGVRATAEQLIRIPAHLLAALADAATKPTMDTGLLVRLLDAARTVTPLAPIAPAKLVLPQLELGQLVRAEVAAQLADGSFRVVINGTALRLALDSGARPGDVVALRLIAREPQLQFKLEATATQTKSSVSSTGRLISQVLSEPAGSPLRQTLPVIATPTTEPEQLREPLARAVERSGLFYESHQARWMHGDYPVERLREEPQAASGRQPQPGSHDDASAAPANQSQPQVRLQLQAQPAADTPHDFHTRETTPAASTSLTPGERTSDPVAQELLPIVRQQLDTLETRHMSWHGEVWPGQFMQWEIAADEHAAGRSDDQRDWQTRLALSLPALGDIGAALSLSAEGISIALSAKDSVAANAMQGASHELRRALEAAGLNVVTVQVRQRESTV